MKNAFTLTGGATHVVMPSNSCQFLTGLCNGGTTHITCFDNISKAAFTLAEVLITLGIIGIVAALTMPALIGNYRKKQTVVQLKKIYSAMSQSVQMSQSNYGDIADWDWTLSTEDFFKRYLSYNFSVLKYCGKKEGCWNKDGGLMPNGNKYSDTPTFQAGGVRSKLTLADGTFIALNKQDNNHVHINVDINGFKRPNTYGIDIFLFTLTPAPFSDTSHKITLPGLFMFGHGLNKDEIKSNYNGCSKNSNGLMCGEKILMDGWDIKDDYPWK